MENIKVPKLSFKRLPRETGLAAVGHHNPNVDIKLAGKRVGSIDGPTWSSKEHLWTVRFTRRKNAQELADPKNNPNCDWRWFTMKVTHQSEELAREWVTKHWPVIISTIHLHLQD